MSIRLSPTSYLVLGYVATAGPSTSYDVKEAVNLGLGHFWSFPHSQLYSEPARLAAAGLLDEEREEGGRRRRTYSITAAGRVALLAWLQDTSAELPEIRDESLLKLFFAEHASADTIVALARNQAEAHAERLRIYEALAADGVPGAPGVALGLGLAWERAATAFWTEVAENPPET